MNSDLNLTNQHKALLITLLLAGTVVLSIFNLSLKKQSEFISESYYEMEPEEELTEEEIKILEALENLNASKAETNKAFNETSNNKQFAQAYKPIAPPEDYVPKNSGAPEQNNAFKKVYESSDDSKLNTEELSSFSKVNDLLKKQQDEGANTKSTISYSLVDRKKIYIPIPVYLCEIGGKIVINITVNAQGDVTDAYVNSSSSTSNECLVEHALEYAKNAQFSTDTSKKSQIGSITFNFIGKR
ncbi:energy transducer TonB family protein [Hwangdonia lutea]|uniref:TonB family protein n=1 Tax=Hwangdonia lutea TaxID=3075823 RepID=A0AA97HS88_9FLAO|nr:TonB family protein [Hwangdonia sp. SCSIO 19198]WOD44850.1 TonB family protein [Hwangdonia sp. SCSIO 19198]